MRKDSFEMLVIGLGFVTVGLLGCKGDDEGQDEVAAESSEVSSTTMTTTDTGTAADTGCIPGELGCACNGGLCLGDWLCVDGVCVVDEPTSESTETGPACDPPNISCNGECVDPLSDPDHCGECGKSCETVLDSGGCVSGSCAPVWSDCIDVSNLTLCPEVCQSQGYGACVTAGCGVDQMSVWWFGALSHCTSGEFSPEAEANACQVEPTGMNSDFYRCCCEQT